MKHRLSRKLVFFYAVLFAVVLAATAFVVHNTVRTELSLAIRSNLEIASDLIGRLVETRADEQWGALTGAQRIATLIAGDRALVDARYEHRYTVYNQYTALEENVVLPRMLVRGRSVSGDSLQADEISDAFGGIAAFYQYSPEGFVLISSSSSASGPGRDIPSFFPARTPMYDLLLRRDSLQLRDHFLTAWYLTAWQVLRDDNGVVGAVFVAVPQVEMERLRRDVLSIRLDGGGSVYVIDASSSRVVIHPSLEGEALWSYPHIRDIQFRRDGFIESVRHDIHGANSEVFVLSHSYISPMNWIVIAETPTAVYFNRLRLIQRALMVVFGAAMVAAILLSTLVGTRITRPIVGITQRIKEISEGEADLTRNLEILSNDEVGELCTYFNTLMEKLRRWKEAEQREAGIRLRDAQMNALEAQINPHFLYNTLETIRFMIAGGDREAVRVVQDLADLLRLSLSHGRRYVPVRNELDHVLHYLAIQRVRFESRFTVSIDIDPAVYDLFTTRFILQPLVENALSHGFRSLERGGRIRIVGRIEMNRVALSVEDNGCGMTPEELAVQQERLQKRETSGSIGLLNVSERLRLNFGDEYGLRITSGAGSGTTVTVLLPILLIEPDEAGLSAASSRNTASYRTK